MDKKDYLETRMWRSMVRLEEYDELNYTAVVPGFSATEKIIISKLSIPLNIRNKVKPIYRCYAMVNIGAEKTSDLRFESWEY